MSMRAVSLILKRDRLREEQRTTLFNAACKRTIYRQSYEVLASSSLTSHYNALDWLRQRHGAERHFSAIYPQNTAPRLQCYTRVLDLEVMHSGVSHPSKTHE